jgi:hypothetical protein
MGGVDLPVGLSAVPAIHVVERDFQRNRNEARMFAKRLDTCAGRLI